MPWQVGIDEAGYGPNLGPFVMSLAAMRVPPRLRSADLWTTLAPVVGRAGDRDTLLTVADSKKIHIPGDGVGPLEANVLPFLHGCECPLTLEDLWPRHVLMPLADLQEEAWYEAGFVLPRVSPHGRCRELDARLADRGLPHPVVCSVVVLPRQFNRLVREHDSKAAVTAWTLKRLLQQLAELQAGEPLRLHVDKLGGRNYYQGILQDALPERFVMCRGESARCSRYELLGEAPFEVFFEPEADDRHFCTALASMFSKYLRELLMEQFNAFWRQHVPGLKPTAGYPGDAARFYADIREARTRLAIDDDVLWRVR